MSNIVFLSHGLRTARKAMSKTARGCGRHACEQHPAILPWLFEPRVTELPLESGMCRPHGAAGPCAADGIETHPPKHAGVVSRADWRQRRMPSLSIRPL